MTGTVRAAYQWYARRSVARDASQIVRRFRAHIGAQLGGGAGLDCLADFTKSDFELWDIRPAAVVGY